MLSVSLELNYGICIEIFFIRNGKMLGRNQFLLNDEDDDEKNLITAFLKTIL